jgi:CRP/FNR family transcriptional regulator
LSGSIKIYREDEDGGEFFMYYLKPGQACAISMICASKNEQSQIMYKSGRRCRIGYGSFITHG